jgi:hypothetical protein
MQDTIAPKGSAADNELPKAASLARMLSYASHSSASPFPSGDIDAAEKGGSVITRLRRRIRQPARASLQVPAPHCSVKITHQLARISRSSRRQRVLKRQRKG